MSSFPCSDNDRKGKSLCRTRFGMDHTQSVGDGRVELLCKKTTTSPIHLQRMALSRAFGTQGGELYKDVIKVGEFFFWALVFQKNP